MFSDRDSNPIRSSFCDFMDGGRDALKGDDYMSIENIRLINVNGNNLFCKNIRTR